MTSVVKACRTGRDWRIILEMSTLQPHDTNIAEKHRQNLTNPSMIRSVRFGPESVDFLLLEIGLTSVKTRTLDEERDSTGYLQQGASSFRSGPGCQSEPREHALRMQSEDGEDEHDQDTGVATQVDEPKLARPPMYKVILLNDDYTPMEFVIHILENFFSMEQEKATQIMLKVHTEGSAVVGIFPRDIAETKSEQVNLYSQENSHPLMSTIEMTD